MTPLIEDRVEERMNIKRLKTEESENLVNAMAERENFSKT